MTSFTPTSGPVGTTVTILGDSFGGVTAVTFNGTPATFNLGSGGLTAVVPEGATTGPISVTTPAGTDSVPHYPPAWFTVTGVAPTIESFSPTSGPAGSTLDIQGAGLTGATSVTFDGTAAAFTVESDSKIRATVPAGATSGKISVTTPTGTANSSSTFTVIGPAPTIDSFTPTSGPAGSAVELHGAGFTGTTSVAFNGTNAAYTVDSDSVIHATVPAGPRAGRSR